MKIIGEKLSNQEMLDVKGGAACWRCQCVHNEGVWYTNAEQSDLGSQISLYCEDGPGSDAACLGMSQIECDIIMQ